MKRYTLLDHLLLVGAAVCAIYLLSGCGHKSKSIHVPHVPYRATFEPAKCHYLPDGIRFQCKDAIFDPQVIDAKDTR